MRQMKKWFKGTRFAFAALALSFIARLPTVFAGFYNPDETCYATIGQRMIEGKAFYIDIIDHKFPLMYHLYAFFAFLGGHASIQVAHMAMIFVVAATSLAVYQIAKRISADEYLPAVAALLYVISANCGKPNDVLAANAELFLNFFAAFFVLFVTMTLNASSGKRALYLAVSGLFIGLAAMIKVHAIFPMAAVIIYLILFSKLSMFERLKSSLIIMGASLVPAILFGVYYYGKGALSDAIYWSLTFNSTYIGGHESGTDLFIKAAKQSLYMFVMEQSALWLPLFAALVLFIKKVPTELKFERLSLILLWLFFSLIAIVPGWYFTGHYFLLPLPALSLMAAVAVRYIISVRYINRGIRAAWFVLLLAPFIVTWIWGACYEKVNRSAESTENAQLITYLKENTLPDEKIEVWGKFNGIPFLAGRENGTRFLNKKLLSGSFDRGELVEVPEKNWEMFFDDMKKNEPAWLVDHSGVDMKNAPLDKFPRLAGYISSHYFKFAEIDGNIVYRKIEKR